MSSGGTDLAPGDVRESTYAVIFVPSVQHPCPNISALQEAADIVQNFDCTVSETSEVAAAREIGLKIFPNPAKDRVRAEIAADDEMISSVEISDFSGRIYKNTQAINQPYTDIETANLSGGVYFLRAKTRSGKIAVSKLVIFGL